MSDDDKFKDVLARWLEDPEFKREWEALEPVYQLACLRIESGLTQAELADLAGTKQPTIARLEGGKVDPHLSSLRRLAGAMGYRMEVRFVPLECASASKAQQ